MKIKADLHNHLGTSPYEGSFNKVIDITKKKLGKGGILGIINYSDFRYENFIKSKGYDRQDFENCIYLPEKDILIIKGQEVLTKQGHLLVLGLDKNKNLKNKRTLEDSLKQARDNNLIIIAVHPFFVSRIGSYLKKSLNLLKYFDAVEIHNGEAFYGNKKAKKFYNEIKNDYEIGGVSFSDGHSLYEIGSSYTLLEKPDENFELESFRKSIKEHKDFSQDKRHFSKLGSLSHSLKYCPRPILLKLRIKSA